MSVKNVITWHSAFTCSLGPSRPEILLGAPSGEMGEINAQNSLITYPIDPKKIIFWISLRVLHEKLSQQKNNNVL